MLDRTRKHFTLIVSICKEDISLDRLKAAFASIQIPSSDCVATTPTTQFSHRKSLQDNCSFRSSCKVL